jgi:hypothetical protein
VLSVNSHHLVQAYFLSDQPGLNNQVARGTHQSHPARRHAKQVVNSRGLRVDFELVSDRSNHALEFDRHAPADGLAWGRGRARGSTLASGRLVASRCGLIEQARQRFLDMGSTGTLPGPRH